MKIVEPKVFWVGETKIRDQELEKYLEWVGAPGWVSDATTDSEKIIEVAGRLCYRSFAPGLNKNVTKIREHNKDYLAHILKVGHGSVLEHAFLNFIFVYVSRVFTHELVRHRAGTAISQESLRLVRLDDLSFWAPTVIKEDQEMMTIFMKSGEAMEALQKKMAELKKLDDPNMKFDHKKKITSAMRRLAPDGIATSIFWSANPRTIRHCIEMRTDPGAEEEIRLVFGMVGEIMQKNFPNLFADYTIEMIDGLPWYKTEHRKV